MDWKAYALIVLTFVWGCRVKAVYAPLILLGLMIPAEKFRSKREMYLMKGGFIVICGLMMLSFILPVLIAPRDIGDTRGDSTSEKGQMAYILGQPLAYAWVLMCNLFRTLPSYVLGENSWGFWDTRERCHFRGRCMLVRRSLSSQPGSHPVENVYQKNRSCGYLYSAWERRCWSGLRCTSHLPDRVIPISTAYRALLPAISAACLAGIKPGAGDGADGE